MSPPAGDVGLEEFRARTAGTLTREDRILIVEQAIQMLDHFYVHRPLKEAMHAVRPIQRLRVLMRRLQQDQRSARGKEELAFHNQVTSVFISVRDLHTNYLLPSPYRDYIAYLPFSVSAFYEEGVRKYLVTRIMPGYQFAAPGFAVGSEICHWNGMPIESAVAANADETAGSNEAARHARGVDALTVRPLSVALPPDANWVDLFFVPAGETAADPIGMHQKWFVRYVPPAPVGAAAATGLSSDGLASTERRREAATAGTPGVTGALPPSRPAAAPARSALTTPHRTHSRRSTSIATPSPGPLIRSLDRLRWP